MRRYTTALGVKHIVEGHVPSQVQFANKTIRRPGEMFQFLGLLFLIDTGMSEGVDTSSGAVLHIGSHQASAICLDGTTTVIWDARNLQGFGRAAPCR